MNDLYFGAVAFLIPTLMFAAAAVFAVKSPQDPRPYRALAMVGCALTAALIATILLRAGMALTELQRVLTDFGNSFSEGFGE